MGMMLLSGIGMGVLFDGYRVVTNELRLPRWWLPVLDMMYWMATVVIVFRVLYASNNGEVRAYVFLGLLIGVVSYYLLLSGLVIRIVTWLIDAVRAVIRFTLKTLDILILKPLLLLYRLVKVILGFGTAVTILLLKIMVQLIRPFWLLFRWILGPVTRPLRRWISPYIIRWRIQERWKTFGSRVAFLWKKWF